MCGEYQIREQGKGNREGRGKHAYRLRPLAEWTPFRSMSNCKAFIGGDQCVWRVTGYTVKAGARLW